ncbi:MAG: hypothetical protein HYU84_03605 [Chloroflexi bacterium]|nr:hypothetical protein [Chloroflexota bacterium]MBI3168627.1 hypothetical protein [Chloroflexota bacterium]
MKRLFLPLLVLTLAACFAPVDAPPPPTSIFSATPQLAVPTLTVAPATSAPIMPTSTPATSSQGFCQDARALQLLSDLQTAIQNRDGELLASLVSPTTGVGVRFIRNGKVVTYFDNVKFIFETTYQADWGLAAGSGEPVKGPFHEIVLPSLDRVFAGNPITTCGELKVGGATYIPEWPYSGMDYYSVHFPGTDQYAGMDWETWAVGMLREEGKPMLAALVHYNWEP